MAHLNNKPVRQESSQDLRTLLPAFSNIQAWDKADMLESAPSTSLEAIRANRNQISGLVKQAGSDAVDVILILLLDQIFALTLSPVSNLRPFAVMIRKNFWDLRFEEIQYVLVRGINGAYGKIFGHLTYPIISEWLSEYRANERPSVAIARAIEKQSDAKTTLTAGDYEEGSVIDQLVKAFKMPVEKTVVIEKSDKPAPTREYMDEMQWGFFVSAKAGISDQQLTDLLETAEKNEFTKTAQSIREEIERRKSA